MLVWPILRRRLGAVWASGAARHATPPSVLIALRRSITCCIAFVPPSGLLYRLSEDFHFDVMVGCGFVAASADQAHVACFDALGIDEFALGGFHVAQVFADALAGGVGSVVIEQGAHVADEIRIVGHLDRSEERRVGKECRSRWGP